MKIKELREYSEAELELLLYRIPFFKELKERDADQLTKVLRFSCLVELQPGEVIMRRGEKGTWLYFLLKGRLGVYRDESRDKALNHITPGELFGDLALLCEHERKATVAAEPGHRGALVFATDFKPFGELESFTPINLATKILFYRILVHSIRWRLEVGRMEKPDHPLAKLLRDVPVFRGEKGSVEELRALHRQAQYLAELLDSWNSYQGVGEGLFVAEQLDQP